jgi:hypothetical protein
MTDLVVSVFQLTNARYRIVPKLSFRYVERNTGSQWDISAGGSRAYTLRLGKDIGAEESNSIDQQNADSTFMVNRVQYALLLPGYGLFDAWAVGRVFLKSLHEETNWFTQTNLPTSKVEPASDGFYDWLKTLCGNTMLRRAASDAHAALSHQHEAGIYVYRGLEWLVTGERRSWDDLADDLGMSRSQVRDFKKLVNVDYGVRHTSRSGAKLRADAESAAMWVCALIDAINATRARIEPGYKIAAPEAVAEAVLAALPPDPYH